MASIHTFSSANHVQNYIMGCNHRQVRDALLQQWNKLTRSELEATGYVKQQIATLIETKYRVHPLAIEYYLTNLEDTLSILPNRNALGAYQEVA